MRNLLGGKGANVAEMTRVLGAELVPAGFTITTEACVEYMKRGRIAPDGLREAVDEALARLEEQAGRRLGDPADPLLVSVRSGARDSMPGMMDTVLNLGLNDASVEGLAQRTGNPRFAWDSYRRLVQMFGGVVRGIPGDRFEEEIARIKRERGVTLDTELDADALRELTRRFQALYDFPSHPREQLEQAMKAVFDSWMGERAIAYRRINGIPDDWGTAVNVQQMVYGNKGQTSASGVAFSRDEVDRRAGAERRLPGRRAGRGRRLRRAHAARPARARRLECRSVQAQLWDILRTLERHYKDMQDTEFTVEDGRLYMLQTRNAKRPAQAAVRFAVDAVEEGLLTQAEAIATIDAGSLEGAAAPDVRRRAPSTRWWRAASPPRRAPPRARSCSRARGRRRRGREGRDVDPRAAVHRGRRRRRLPRRQGHPHLRGRQGVARRARRARHGPPGRHRRGRARRSTCTPARSASTATCCTRATWSRSTAPPARSRSTTCRWSIPTVDERFETVLKWCDELRTLSVRANADTPEDARRAHEFGAEGIGLCRTEHMFMAADRQPKMQRMIMAADEAGRRAVARGAAAAPAVRLRGPLRGDGRAPGDDPAARPAAARVHARSHGARREGHARRG